MANVSPVTARFAGCRANTALAAAAASYTIGGDVECMIVNNGSGASITVTVATPGLANVVTTVAAGVFEVFLFTQGGGGPRAHSTVTLSATATVTAGFYSARTA